MKIQFYLSLLIIIIFNNISFAQQTAYYIPGTGSAVKELNFESNSLLTQNFNYGSGWAGQGFGLSGTQRGAPEIVNVIANPEMVTSSGNQVLAFRSQDRDAAWYTANPSAVGTTYYGSADTGTQDDFFMYSGSWIASETPSVMMHVFVPSTVEYYVTSLRMPVKYNGAANNSWPGIWCYGDKLNIRGPGRNDITITTNAPNGGRDTWWTLGVSIAPDGDIQYYATPSFVTELTPAHCIGFNSVLSPQYGHAYYPVDQNSDAVIMCSNINTSSSPTLIDRMYYTKGVTQVLNVFEDELIPVVMYPNPTSEFLFVKGLKNETAYEIFDSLGKVIKTGLITTASYKIQVDALSNGLYFLSLEGYSKKIFIKK